MYLSFINPSINVAEDMGTFSVCLELRNVSEPTQSVIWADIDSEDSSAMGKGTYILNHFACLTPKELCPWQ